MTHFFPQSKMKIDSSTHISLTFALENICVCDYTGGKISILGKADVIPNS